MTIRYFCDHSREHVRAVEEEDEARMYAADPAYIEIAKPEFDGLIDSDPWRPQCCETEDGGGS